MYAKKISLLLFLLIICSYQLFSKESSLVETVQQLRNDAHNEYKAYLNEHMKKIASQEYNENYSSSYNAALQKYNRKYGFYPKKNSKQQTKLLRKKLTADLMDEIYQCVQKQPAGNFQSVCTACTDQAFYQLLKYTMPETSSYHDLIILLDVTEAVRFKLMGGRI